MSKKSLAGQVVVITGASSGNGKAAAVEFAKAGANLVVAARRFDALQALVQELESLDVEALAVKTDVSVASEVDALAKAAVERFGRIDVWVNNAGIGAVGALNQTPLEAHVKVVSTNLLGVMYGAYSVMPYFKKQKSGVMITTNSVGTWVPLPYASAYSASKFGLRGFLDALRAEVSNEADIHICEVAPAFVNTPGIEHAANYIGGKIANPIGAGNPKRVARAMVELALHPKTMKPVMGMTQVARAGYFLFPKFTRWASARAMDYYFEHAEKAPTTDGAIFETMKKGEGVYADDEAAAPLAPRH